MLSGVKFALSHLLTITSFLVLAGICDHLDVTVDNVLHNVSHFRPWLLIDAPVRQNAEWEYLSNCENFRDWLVTIPAKPWPTNLSSESENAGAACRMGGFDLMLYVKSHNPLVATALLLVFVFCMSMVRWDRHVPLFRIMV